MNSIGLCLGSSRLVYNRRDIKESVRDTAETNEYLSNINKCLKDIHMFMQHFSYVY